MSESFPGATQPRPAATLVILRDGEAGVEVLLTIRPRTLRFMGGAAVFPGGAVAEADLDPAWERVSALAGEDAATSLGEEDARGALGSYICALRESFEEVGLFLGEIDHPPDRDEAADARSWLRNLEERGARLATDRMTPAGRWVTPLGAPVRFDTWFFIAESPPGWEPEPDPSEVEEAFWMRPEEALDALASERLRMAPPTIEALQRLAGHRDVRSAIAELHRLPVGPAGNVLSMRLSPLVHAVLAPNPGVMTGPGTNTYVVGTGPMAVIDPAVPAEEYIEEVLRAAGEVELILVTHRHEDHIGGIEELVRRTGARVRAFGRAPAGGAEVEPLEDGEEVDVGGIRLRALHTPGHASDHLCFFLEGPASLFSGDNVLGEGTSVIAPPDGNMRDFMASLDRLAALDIDRIYPGHFRPLDGGRPIIEDLLEHRRQRESAVLEAVRGGASSVEEIVARVYVDTPSHLHPVALFSVTAHLEMLEDEGRVRRADDRWSATLDG